MLVSSLEPKRYASALVRRLFIDKAFLAVLSNTTGRRSSESQWLATTLAVQHLLRVRNTRSARAAAARQLMLVSYAQYLAAPDISRNGESYAKSLATGPFWRPWLPGGPKRRLLQAALGWKLALKAHSVLKGLAQ